MTAGYELINANSLALTLESVADLLGRVLADGEIDEGSRELLTTTRRALKEGAARCVADEAVA